MTSFSKLYIRNILLKNDPDFALELQPGALVPSRRYDDPKINSKETSESSLSSHRDAHLHLSLGPKIGCGRVGTVHDVIPLDKSGSPVEWSSLGLPPLVVKIASVNRNVELSKEAWFYEQLKDLQNVAIARCYGFFQTALRPEHAKRIAPWKEGHWITPSPSPPRSHTGASTQNDAQFPRNAWGASQWDSNKINNASPPLTDNSPGGASNMPTGVDLLTNPTDQYNNEASSAKIQANSTEFRDLTNSTNGSNNGALSKRSCTSSFKDFWEASKNVLYNLWTSTNVFWANRTTRDEDTMSAIYWHNLSEAGWSTGDATPAVLTSPQPRPTIVIPPISPSMLPRRRAFEEELANRRFFEALDSFHEPDDFLLPGVEEYFSNSDDYDDVEEEDDWEWIDSGDASGTPYRYQRRLLTKDEKEKGRTLRTGRRRRPKVISIFVIEKFSDPLPLDNPPHLPEIEQDIRDIHDDFWALKFFPGDCGYKHIFKAGTEGALCPNHGYVHKWRVIDLGLGHFCKTGSVSLQKLAHNVLTSIFTDLADGKKYNPHACSE